MDKKFKFSTMVGDRFKLQFNFKTRKCIAYYNEECLGLLTDNLPYSIRLAATVYYSGQAFETTAFEVE